MPGDPLREYRIGELLDAATVNSNNRFQKRGRPFSTPGVAVGPTSTAVVMMRNDSGEDVSRFGVLGIDGVVIERADNDAQFDNQILLSGIAPDSANAGKFAITLQPIADGDIGKVVVAGAVQCQINVNDTADEFADMTDGDNTQLNSGARGARILAAESGTGLKWGVVLLPSGIHGIIDERYSTGTHAIEVTFDGTVWVPKVVFAACSSGPPTPAFGF